MLKHAKAVLIAALVTLPTLARTLTPEEKRADLDQLASLIRSQYGPYDYKKTKLGLKLDELVSRYAKEAEPLSNIDYYYLVNRFVAEFQDSHFKSRLKTNHVSFLGFAADRVEGKIVVESIDRGVLPPWGFPFNRGDEIVTFDGKPVAETIATLAKHIGAGYEDTRLRLAAFQLAHRASALVPPQQGKVTIGIKPRGSDEVKDVELEWRHTGDPLEEGPMPWSTTAERATPNYFQLSLDLEADYPKLERGKMCSGLTNIRPPAGAEPLIVQPFVAYTHPSPKGKIGYLRIPHYAWGSDATLRYRQYQWVISKLEESTVGLIVDQTHNCGGSINFLEDMVALFAKAPFEGLSFQFLASRTEFFHFNNFMEQEALATTLQGDGISSVLTSIRKAWQDGQRLTPRLTFHGSRKLLPNAIRYTKPVLVLIDEMSGSGGDAFPALMQGIGRAKLFGKRTMGAGGNVVQAPQLNYSGNQVNITKSMFFHPNGEPIENNGAKPDYPYVPTLKDFTGGYEDYRKEYLATLYKMIEQEAPATMPLAKD